jgi:hypothetical protein
VKQNYFPAGFAFNPASFSSIAERMNLKYEHSRGANAAPANPRLSYVGIRVMIPDPRPRQPRDG